MCGFAGVVSWDEKYRVTRDTLARMGRAIAHRGPDGEGCHLTRENEPITPDTPQVGLAFRRLAILDPDPRSNQPFHIGPLTLVFNGEIYNFRDLKSEISNLRPAYHWRTTGDTEVLLMAYEVWREKCVEKLNGMFAFAVWDQQKKELFLARDRMGQKPLYLARIGWSDAIAFASEIGALRQVPWIPWELDGYELQRYLRWGYTPHIQTTFSGVGRTGPATRLHISRQRTESASHDDLVYFDPNAASASAESSAVSETRRLLLRATERQLVSDVPLGVFISGGIDSSVIAVCARQCGPVKTFSIGFDDARYDETPYAAAVARHIGTEHYEFRVTPRVIEDLPRLVSVFGEPFADSSMIPTHYLSRETRQHVKVALSGDGGDELFGGYDRYRAMRLTSRASNSPRLARRFVATVARPWSGGHPKSRLTRAARLLGALELDDAARYASYIALFDPSQICELLSQDSVGAAWEFEERFRALHENRDSVQAALALDRITYLPDDLLTKVDRCSMMHGLEVRSPFMDHELVQFAAGLTTEQLLKGGPKRMLREAFAKDLPDFVFKRKKMGFAVPIGEWFRGELRPMLRENLFASDAFGRSRFNMKVVERLVDEHERQRVDHSQRLYALLMLELWWRHHRSASGS